MLTGCSHFKTKPSDDYVFVTAKSANLRDRVAAVSNRTGQVANGEKLKVLDHARHFVKVQTSKGEVGWIEEKSIATETTAADFDTLKEQHKNDPEVASGVTRDVVYMHLTPGRETEHFYLLPEGEKLKLIKRATLVKAMTQQTAARASQKAIPQAAGSNAARKDFVKPASDVPPPPPAMEDWWLVRDSAGHAGWVFARMMDVDAPDSLTRYAEGQRIVGAYLLTTVHDDGAPTELKDIPEYVAVMSPYKAGLPYDFDQVRVFIWSLGHHRYETAFRDRNVEGYLPVRISKMKDPYGKSPVAGDVLPSFSYKVLASDAPPVVPDPSTGAMIPTKTVEKTYRLEGNLVRRVLPVGMNAPEEAHPVAETEKKKHRR